uniref:Uncharacterized protein n=1 Tax=Globodera pallida TaxID=36090 RepID=A0A183CU23_GLOPA
MPQHRRPLVVQSVRSSPTENSVQIRLNHDDDHPLGSATCSELFPDDDRITESLEPFEPLGDFPIYENLPDAQSEEEEEEEEMDILTEKCVRYLAFEPPNTPGKKPVPKQRRKQLEDKAVQAEEVPPQHYQQQQQQQQQQKQQYQQQQPLRRHDFLLVAREHGADIHEWSSTSADAVLQPWNAMCRLLK